MICWCTTKPILTSIIIVILILKQQKTCWAKKSCHHRELVNVSRDDDPYNVFDEIKPESLQTFGCAEVEFVSKDASSHVCLQQINNISKINDSNVELIVLDGTATVITLKYYPNAWKKREICSSSNSFKFQLKKVYNKIEVKPNSIFLYFQIVHIESPHRKLYMGDNYCDETFRMNNSIIEILSKYPYTSEKSSELCGINIEKNEPNNRNICLYYKLKPREQVGFSWNLYVTTEKYSMEPKHLVFNFNANSSTTNAWCSNIGSVMLIFERTNIERTNSVSPQQEKDVFSMLLVDFNGSRESFLEFINSTTLVGTTTQSILDSSVNNAHVIVIPIVILSVTITTALVFAVLTLLLARYLCNTVTKRTACSSTFLGSKHKFEKADIVVVTSDYEHKNLLNNL